MQIDELERYRKQLEILQSRVTADATALDALARSPSGGQAAGDLSNTPSHLGDMGTDEFLHDMNALLGENEIYIAQEVRAALERIRTGDFGNCEACEVEIHRERLDAIPYTRYCIECARVEDGAPQPNLNTGRPRKPSDTLAPEGRRGEHRGRTNDAVIDEAEGDRIDDQHAAGEAAGGTAVGGLAGANLAHGEPVVAELNQATGSGPTDGADNRPKEYQPLSGREDGAVGGTPARKRSD